MLSASKSFDFVPRLVYLHREPFIAGTNDTAPTYDEVFYKAGVHYCLLPSTCSIRITYTGGNSGTANMKNPMYYNLATVTSWYIDTAYMIAHAAAISSITINSGGARAQMNEIGATYHYIAVG